MPAVGDVLAWLSITDEAQISALTPVVQRVMDAVVEQAEDDYELPAEYSARIDQALIMQAARLYKRKSTTEGVMSFDAGGVIRVGAFDADVDRLLARYRKFTIG